MIVANAERAESKSGKNKQRTTSMAVNKHAERFSYSL
jgi:hypothetical protein